MNNTNFLNVYQSVNEQFKQTRLRENIIEIYDYVINEQQKLVIGLEPDGDQEDEAIF